MSETWYPKAIRRPITTLEYWSPRPRPLISICNHITDGLDSRDYLQNVNNGSSVNFLVREENGVGVVYQFMPVEWAAWGNGIWSEGNQYMPQWIRNLLPALRQNKDNINFYTVSIEHERKWPFTTTLPESMKAATIDLQRWLAQTFPTIIVDRDHIIGHYQIDNIRKANCPGGPGGKLFPFEDIIAAIKSTPVPAGARFFPETGFYIQGGFRTVWEQYGLTVMGYPLSNEYATSDGYTRQDFENARLRYKDGDVVRFDAVNRELLQLTAGH
jgi:N-acetyl-anhydromuramyl-L-alanine amidase AmpD